MFKEINRSIIPGCFEFIPDIKEDKRGMFVKIYNSDFYRNIFLGVNIKESYFTISRKNVIRGLHFQLPPYEVAKIVCCVEGEIMDVVVDLREGSPTYGRHDIFYLSAKKSNILYIPEGLAHGYCVLSEKAIVVYNVTNVYSKEHDTGIRWDSIGIPWPVDNPILSEKDKNLPEFKHFNTPFKYSGYVNTNVEDLIEKIVGDKT